MISSSFHRAELAAPGFIPWKFILPLWE